MQRIFLSMLVIVAISISGVMVHQFDMVGPAYALIGDGGDADDGGGESGGESGDDGGGDSDGGDSDGGDSDGGDSGE